MAACVRGTNRMIYRYVVYDNEGAAPDVALINTGYAPSNGAAGFAALLMNDKTITSLTQCISEALSETRAMQRLGRDVRADVFGRPDGVDASTPVRALTADERNEQPFAHLDILEHGWRQRINLANRCQNSGGDLDPDYQEDV